MTKRSAFTLVEVLVVITIIGLLAILAFNSYLGVQRRSRDTIRKGNLKNIQNALEQYYSICGYVYPTPGSGGIVASPLRCTSPFQTFLNPVPRDPRSNSSYTMGGGGNAYAICAPNTPPLEAETSATYCLTQVQ